MDTKVDPAFWAQLETIKATAEQMDASRTERVTVADLAIGDVITELGGVVFPFPFTLSSVTVIGKYGSTLAATHGWFTPGPKTASTPVVRVVR
jgi:hypothetical protein